MKDGLIRSGEFGEGTGTGDGEGEKVKLAALLPGVARWTHLALNGVPNEIIEASALFIALACANDLIVMVKGICRTERGGGILGNRALVI
jgi:hypothetical protein